MAGLPALTIRGTAREKIRDFRILPAASIKFRSSAVNSN